MGTQSVAPLNDEDRAWAQIILPADIKEPLLRAWHAIRATGSQKDKSVDAINILLSGPPGTGKTEIRKAFAKLDSIRLIELTQWDLIGNGFIGQCAMNLAKVFSEARTCAPAVLSMDAVQYLLPRSSFRTRNAFTAEVVVEMAQQMESMQQLRCPVFVIGETYSAEEVDPVVLKFFNIRLEIPLPDEASRRQILMRYISQLLVDPVFDVEEISTLLARRLEHSSGRDLENLVRGALERALERTSQAGTPDAIVLTRDDLLNQLQERR